MALAALVALSVKGFPDNYQSVYLCCMFKVIVAGSETFNDYKLLKQKLDFYLQNKKDIMIISGGVKGADELGVRYAHEKGYILKQVDTEWNKYGELVEAKRNERMALEADGCIIFWSGSGSGIVKLIESARKFNLSIKVVLY